MIRNIVFDFGNVLVRFEPDGHLAQFVPASEIDEYKKLIYLSKPWKDGDRGLMERDEIIDTLLKSHPDKQTELMQIMPQVSNWLTMPEDTPAFLDLLRTAGYRLFYISNTNRGDFDSMMSRNPAMRALEGGIASFKEGILKPDKRIFELFLDRYQLPAAECLFIDDMPENTTAAGQAGMQTLTLNKGADNLRPALYEHPEIGPILKAFQ